MVSMQTGWSRAEQEVAELSDQIDRIVNEVKKAILAVEEDKRDDAPSIKAAQLTLRAIRTEALGGGFEFKIFGFGIKIKGKVTEADTQTIQLKLVPADAAETFSEEEVSATLVTALRAVRDSAARAAASEPRFKLEEGSIELNFEVTQDGEIEIVVVGEAERTNIQTVSLSLGPPA